MGWDQGIANKLRAAGLNVVEVAGWQTRGSSSFSPKGFVRHHTAGPASGNSPSLNICIYGRSDLAGPLCNVFQARDNTIYVVAAGRANHAGTGGWKGLSGNSTVYGIEVENTGTEPWREDQLDTTARVCAALTSNVDLTCEHKEWAPNRKPDRHTVNGQAERERMRRFLGSTGAPPAAPPDLVAIANGIKEARTHTLRSGDKGDAVKWLQAGINNRSGRGLTVDGDFGPATETAVRDLQRFFKQPETGVADAGVWAILFDLPAAPAAPAAPANDGAAFLTAVANAAKAKPTLRKGSRGGDVADVQRVLVIPADGVFGARTEAAVKKFQASKGLAADGIVGYNTWVQLIAKAFSK